MTSANGLQQVTLLKKLRETPGIFALLQGQHGDELALQTQLRQRFPAELVRAALTLHDLRQKGARKFSRASEMWFDRTGLEQATSEPVARHKALRFQSPVIDLCSGIGGDALALAAKGPVISVDSSPAACLCTRWNSDVYSIEKNVRVVCGRAEDMFTSRANVHIDPDRRIGSRGRAVRVEDCAPGLDFLQRLLRKTPGGAIKLSPAANFFGKFNNVEIELISLGGECKEATVWYGELAGPHPFRATVLPAGESIAGNPLDAVAQVSPLGRYLYDPDPAVVRSGMLDLAAEQCGLNRLDAEEEYLTSDLPVESAFYRAFEVLDVLTNNRTELRRYFRKADFGELEIKCRRVHVPVDNLRRSLSLNGHKAGVLIFAKLAGKTRAIVCRRMAQHGAGSA